MKKNNSKKISTQAKKEFRHKIAVLKKKGLVSKTYDARSVEPTKYLKSVVKQFGDVLEGKATPVKVSKEKAAYYKEQGHDVKNGRVIVHHLENEKVYGTHGNFVTKITTPSGSITRINKAIPTTTIAAWEEGLRKEFKRLKKGERLSFQIGGNFTDKTFEDIEDLLMFLRNYNSFDQAESSGDPNKVESLISAIVIYKLDRTMGMPKNTKSAEQIAHQKAKRAEQYAKYVARRSPEAQEMERQNRKEAAKKHRGNRTPEQIEADKIKARERAKKSYNARVAKNGKKDSRNN